MIVASALVREGPHLPLNIKVGRHLERASDLLGSEGTLRWLTATTTNIMADECLLGVRMTDRNVEAVIDCKCLDVLIKPLPGFGSCDYWGSWKLVELDCTDVGLERVKVGHN